jgi:hypothetical protein
MRTAVRGLVALGTILALFAPGASGVVAAGISASPNAGAVGTATMVSGNGFAANTPVRILFNGSSGTQLGSPITSDGSGNLPSTSVVIPSVTAGTYQIFATDGANTATTSFTVPFNLSLSPASGGVGTGVNVSGAGFLANEGVVIGWDQPGNQVVTGTTNGNGGFSLNFTVPNGSGGGNHNVFATGQSSHFVVSATFNVGGGGNVGGANLALSPTVGRAGSTVSLNATGFGANEQVNLAVDGGVATSVTSDGNGNFATTLQLSSSLALGAHTISATGTSSGHSASVTFFVTNQRAQQAAAVACGSGDDRPGNGFGDDNHCHTGPRGHDGDDGHGHDGDNGHGHGHGNDNDQGDDS